MKRLLLILVAVMTFCACGDDEEPEKGEQCVTGEATGNFMTDFFSPTKLQIVDFYSKDFYVDEFYHYLDPNAFVLWLLEVDPEWKESVEKFNIWFQVYAYNDDYIFQYNDDRSTKREIFNEYAACYGDTICQIAHDDRVYFGCVYPISSINITADKDFDESHPAGTSLNDIFTYTANYYDEFIQNGCWGDISYESKNLSDLEGLRLSDYEMSFSFKQKPATPGTYTFTVSITFDPDPVTGKTISLEPATTTITFE